MLVFKRADNPRQQREVNHESLACCNRRYVDLIGALLVSAGFFLASMTTSLIFLYTVFGLIVGAGNGFGYATLYSTRNLGMNYGLLFTAWGAAGIIGPMVGARVFDAFGDYRYAFYAGSGLAFVAFASLTLAAWSRPAGRVPQVQSAHAGRGARQ